VTVQETIHLAVDRLVKSARPTRVILFGSHATGRAKEGSDIDLLVVEQEVSSKRKEMVRLREAVGQIGFPVDVFVCSEEELADWGHLPGSVLYRALKEGKVLYEATH
jgi:predicted nucleotidyltransferase